MNLPVKELYAGSNPSLGAKFMKHKELRDVSLTVEPRLVTPKDRDSTSLRPAMYRELKVRIGMEQALALFACIPNFRCLS